MSKVATAGPMSKNADTKHHKVQPPWPLVKATRHPIRWTKNKVELLAAAGMFAHLGTLIIVALYYLLFEINGTANGWWHSAVSNSNLRHDIRGVGEGLLGGFLAQQIVWNHYKKMKVKKRKLLDKIEIWLRIPNIKANRQLSFGQLVASPLFAILYALPGFVAGYFIVHGIHDANHHLHAVVTFHPASTGVWARTRTIWTQSWPQKAMGLGASIFFGRRPMKAVFDDVQTRFVLRRLQLGKTVRWYHTPPFKARYNDLLAERQADIQAGAVVKSHPAVENTILISTVMVGLGLAIYGWYVLTYIANA